MDLVTSLRKASALDRLGELEVQDAQLFAARAQALVDAEDVCRQQPDAALALSCLPMDVAMVCSVAQSTASMRLEQARRLVRELPLTWQHLAVGDLRVGQALALLEETKGLDVALCQEVDARSVPRIFGLTSGDTRRLVKRLIVTIDAAASEARRSQRARERRCWVSPRADGRAFVGAEQSAEDAGAFLAALTELAGRTFAADEVRTIDQQRADLFSQLPHFALAHDGGRPGPTLRSLLGLPEAGVAVSRRTRRAVQAVVLVPVESALDLADSPAELVGYGPITGAHARELLAVAELRQACTDAVTGRILALDDDIVRPPTARWGQSAKAPGHGQSAKASGNGQAGGGDDLRQALLAMVRRPMSPERRHEGRHDPSPGLSDLIRLRDTRCSGPGCAQPARICDLDHLVPYPLGPTTAGNLGPVSRRCHNAKTHGGWTLQPHPDGTVTWTSPLGRSTTRPSRTTAADLNHLRPLPPRPAARSPALVPHCGPPEPNDDAAARSPSSDW